MFNLRKSKYAPIILIISKISLSDRLNLFKIDEKVSPFKTFIFVFEILHLLFEV